jgi:hypothetical protein
MRKNSINLKQEKRKQFKGIHNYRKITEVTNVFSLFFLKITCEELVFISSGISFQFVTAAY